MATRTRQRRAAAEGALTPAQAAIALAVDDDELKADGADGDDGEHGAEAPGISLSREDFDGNPTVIDMAQEVDGIPGTASEGRRQPAAERTVPTPRGRVRVRLIGLRNPKRPNKPFAAPYGVTVIVPAATAIAETATTEDPNGYLGQYEDGTTVQFTRGRAVPVTTREAEWLKGHPHYLIETL